MKTVRFLSSDPLQKQFGDAVRKDVGNYFKEKGISSKGNTAMYIKTIMMLSIYLVPFVIILSTPVSTGMAVLLVIVMGIGEAGIGMSVMHDAAHGVYSEKKWVNNLFASSMYLLGGNPFNWKIQHNILHHRFTNIYGLDQDIETKALLRLCEHAPIKKIHRFQYVYAFFLYGLMTLAKLFMEFKQLQEFNKAGITEEQRHDPRKEMTKLALSKLIYFFVVLGLPIWLTDFSWWQILVGFSIMHVTAGIIMSTIFQMAHIVEGALQPIANAQGVIENEWSVHELYTTSDFARNNFWLNWYAGGLNFQIEHHLFPNVCHIHYRKIAPIVEHTAREFGYTYNLKPTFISALISHIKRLKELGISGPKE